MLDRPEETRPSSKPHRLLQIGTLVLAAGMFMLVSVLALSAALIWNDYRSSFEAGELRARAAAHVIAANFQWIFEASDQTLRRLDAAFQQTDIAAVPDTIADINEIVGNLPRGFQYAIYDAKGNLTYSSVANASRIKVEDRDYFRRLQNGAEEVISEQLDERVTKEKVFVIARRLSVGNDFIGAVTIAVPGSRMQELSESLAFSYGSTVSLLRTDGTLIARFPQLDNPQNYSSAQVFEELKANGNGSYMADSVADGQTRIVGYWKLEGWPVLAIAGLDVDAFLKPFWARVRFWLAIGIPSMLIVITLLTWIAQLMRREQVRGVELSESMRRNEFLMREIHHRVKNNLQIVASLVRLQKMPQAERESLSSRIAAMVAIHEEVYRSDQFEKVAVGPYLKRLVGDITEAYGSGATIDFDFDEIELSGDRAMQVGLLLNELVSNSFKHAIGVADGTLEVSLKRVEDEKIELKVKDNGPGYTPDAASTSMGNRLIAAFVAQLDAELNVSFEGGTATRVRFAN